MHSTTRRIWRRRGRRALKAAGAASVIIAVLLVGIGTSIELRDAQEAHAEATH